jgi:ubiquinone/menaquinone biosynthesis C-methylase UbiE
MVSSWVVEILRCPETMQKLTQGTDGLHRIGDNKFFPDKDGITSLVYPEQIDGMDELMNRRYEWLAPYYDFSERILGRLLTGVDMEKGREDIVKLLELQKVARLLEVSPGPGVFQPLLRSALGADAKIVSLDLSLGMLKQCKKQQALLNIELVQANAQRLPFEDDSFDALFHFGGINLFNEPQKALSEFMRVVRKGGLIAWGDEQMSEEFRHPVGRWLLPIVNPGFHAALPQIPSSLIDVRSYTVYNGLGYLITAKNGDKN